MNNIKEKILQYKKTIISLMLVSCSVVCVFTGCFSNNVNNINTPKKQIKLEEFKYNRFVTTWNNILLKNKYFITFNTRDLLLPNTNNDVIKKLNQIFAPNRIQIQIQKYKKFLTDNNMLNIPLKMYIAFLEKGINFKKDKFTKNLSEQQIEKMILFMLNSNNSYLSVKTLKKLSWTYSFKNYFKDNITSFEKKGFTKNINSYEKYRKIVNIKK